MYDSMSRNGDKKQEYLLKVQAKAYAGSSSIHGLGYIAEGGRPIYERILWIILCIASLILCIVLISPIYSKWRDTPTYTSINTTNYPVWNMPFPGVTICSNIIINKAQMRDALKGDTWKGIQANYNQNDSYFEWSVYEALKLYSKFSSNEEMYNIDNEIALNIINHNTSVLTQLVQRVRHRCKDIFLLCTWQDKKENCTPHLFETSRTDDGYCCSFNTLKISEQFDNSVADFTVDYSNANWVNSKEDDCCDSSMEGGNPNDGLKDDNLDDNRHDNGNGDDLEDEMDGDYNYKDGPDKGETDEDLDFLNGILKENSNSSPGASTNADEETDDLGEDLGGDYNDPGDDLEGEGGGFGRSRKRRKRRSTPADENHDETSNLRVLNSASARNGLTVMLKLDTDAYEEIELDKNTGEIKTEYNFAKNDFYGFRVLVHSPYEFPEVGGKGFAVSYGNVAYIGVSARVTTSTDKVKSMAIKRRNCVKQDEDNEKLEEAGINMDLFEKYSRRSCLLECRAQELLEECDCLPYYFPEFGVVWEKSTACNITGLKCLARNSNVLTSLKTDISSGADCFCPLECDDTMYAPELSQVRIRQGAEAVDQKIELDPEFQAIRAKIATFEEALEQHPNNTQIEERLEKIKKAYESAIADPVEDMAIIHVYFKELGTIQYSRDELYSITDFIAAAGGLIGLCIGFSLLSGAELIYWFTIRMMTDYGRKKRVEANEHSAFQN